MPKPSIPPSKPSPTQARSIAGTDRLWEMQSQDEAERMEGVISDRRLDESVDSALLERLVHQLLRHAPNVWQPARDSLIDLGEAALPALYRRRDDHRPFSRQSVRLTGVIRRIEREL